MQLQKQTQRDGFDRDGQIASLQAQVFDGILLGVFSTETLRHFCS